MGDAPAKAAPIAPVGSPEGPAQGDHLGPDTGATLSRIVISGCESNDKCDEMHSLKSKKIALIQLIS
jgi:hypothetical protein